MINIIFISVELEILILVKRGRCNKELERIYGVIEESAGKSEPKLSDGNIFNQSDIAEMIGISVDTLNNYKKLIY